MNSIFRSESTSATLRILADKIDKEEAPDFMIVIRAGGNYCTAHRSEDDMFGLLGAARWEMDAISREIDV